MLLRTEESYSIADQWYNSTDPLVSIVILNYNKARLTIECLKSIWQYTTGSKYEIIVVDNGSQEQEYRQLVDFKGCYKLLRLDINRFFGEGNNIGAEVASGEFIVFMNNDVTVTSNWLSPLMYALRELPNCGAAGPKFLYPNGLLQEAGALVDSTGGAVQIGKFQDPDLPRFNILRVVDYVSAATVIMRRDKFEEVLGFNFIYEPAYYEDVDLCLKLKQLGLDTYYVPESTVIHHENATTADPRNKLLLNDIVSLNRGKFVARWSSFIEGGLLDRAVKDNYPVIRPAEKRGQPTAALYTPYNINPGGGERHFLSMAEVLLKAGYHVILLTPEKYSSLRISKIAGVFELDLQGLSLLTYEEAIRLPKFDLFFALANELLPPVRGLGEKNIYCCQFPFPCAEKELARREPFLSNYNAYFLYSEFVKTHLEALILSSPFKSIPYLVLNPPVDILQYHWEKDRKKILSVGRFFTGGHCKQQHMLIKAFRRLCQLGIKSELHLVGSLPSEASHRAYFFECQQAAEGLPIFFHVDASNEKLVDLYRTSSVYWHGTGFEVDVNVEPEKCEHFGISVVEAMSAGVVPVVVANGGPVITVNHGVNGYCYDDEDSLIRYTMDVFFAEEADLRSMRDAARMRSLDFSTDVFQQRMSDLLDQVVSDSCDLHVVS